MWHNMTMDQKELRVRISENLFKRYKHICLDNELSVPKQTQELIRKFVEIQEENKKRLNIGEK